MFARRFQTIWQFLKRTVSGLDRGGGSAERASANAEPKPESTPEDRTNEVEDDPDPRGKLEAECYDLSFRETRNSWALEADEKTLKAKEARGVSRAQALHRRSTERSEQRQLEKLQALDSEHEKCVAARDRARAVAQARAQERAKLGEPKPRPAMSPMFRSLATLALTISIAPTLHDLLVGLHPDLKWLVGGGCAWGVSLLIIQALMPLSEATTSNAAPAAEQEEQPS